MQSRKLLIYSFSLSQPEDPLERMIGVARYCFSKELKFAVNNICIRIFKFYTHYIFYIERKY